MGVRTREAWIEAILEYRLRRTRGLGIRTIATWFIPQSSLQR
jgi:hypothetical protein